MNTRTLWKILVALALWALFAVPITHAQLQSGNLFVSVADESGQALPGVTVTISGPTPPQIQVTNAEGQARYLDLAPGSYSLKAELEGFSTLNYPNIEINVGGNTSIEVTMSPIIDEVIVPDETPEPAK
ncbi:carboxypeptidase-like regulatory domain-containing protein [Ahniella affigens]|nr:carboxypeptidase-like regulatory domain-containing protein [Ahniella affigens]